MGSSNHTGEDTMKIKFVNFELHYKFVPHRAVQPLLERSYFGYGPAGDWVHLSARLVGTSHSASVFKNGKWRVDPSSSFVFAFSFDCFGIVQIISKKF